MSVEERTWRVLAEELAEGSRRLVDEGAVDLLIVADALAPDEGERWRAALVRAADEREPRAADPELARRIVALIDALPTSGLRHGALDLAVALGAMTQRERVRRFAAEGDGVVPDLELLDLTGESSWTLGVEVPPEMTPEEIDELFGLEYDDHEPEPDPRGPLTRVLAAPVARHAGVRLTSIALHERATAVRWHAARASAEGDAPFPQRSFELRLADDAGTDYGPARDAGGSAGSLGRSGTIVFDVPVPSHVRMLHVTWGGATAACDAVRP